MTNKVRATMHGAISIVNAIATGKGSALGISLKVTAVVSLENGQGIKFHRTKDDKLLRNVVYKTIPAEIIANNMISIQIESEIPLGFGLKSSSAVSNAVALACSRLIDSNMGDYTVLDIAVSASLDAKVTVTGAYDDAAACYFGGFVLTDNYARNLIRREKAPDNLYAIILLPQNASRGNINKLSIMSDFFINAFNLAEAGEYWKAMKLNGVLASAALSVNYEPVLAALERHALGASVSGNGPSLAAVAYENRIDDIKSVFGDFNGNILVSKINNQKASVEKIIG
ncbi:MAG: shikimate kinase [Nitrososphaeraceae archaeon]